MWHLPLEDIKLGVKMHKKKKSVGDNKKSIIAVLFIGAGCALAAAIACSFFLSDLSNNNRESEFEKARSITATTSSVPSSSDDNSDNVKSSSDNQKSKSADNYVNDNDSSKMTVDSQKLYEDSVAYNRKLKSNQSNLLTNKESYTYSALKLTDYGITNDVYAYITADSISLNVPVYLGANNSNMAYGAAHLCYTSLPTGGKDSNVVLSGHTGYIGRWIFDSIPSLKTGDTVTIKNYWGDVKYKVVSKVTRSPNDGQDMYIDKGKDKLTLITCVSDGKGGFNRCVVICER